VHIVGVHADHLLELILYSLFGLSYDSSRLLQFLDVSIGFQQLLPERYMGTGTLLKHFLKGDDQIVVVKELVDVHRLVGQVFGVVFDHVSFNKIDLMVKVQSVQECVLMQNAGQ
jgi:hypothetical protein